MKWGWSKDKAKKLTHALGGEGDAGKSNQFHRLTGKHRGDCATEQKGSLGGVWPEAQTVVYECPFPLCGWFLHCLDQMMEQGRNGGFGN